MKNVVVLHGSLFTPSGSTEKLLIDIIGLLADSGDYMVHAVYDAGLGTTGADELGRRPGVSLHPFHTLGPPPPPADHLTTEFDIDRMLSTCRPDAVLLVVSDAYNVYAMMLPPTIPLFVISPFGAYATNGNVRKLYVSGRGNTMALRGSGIHMAEQFFNPLHVPEFDPVKAGARDMDRPVVFGRTGRDSDAIFDPISLTAYARLEATHGDRVRYVYVNPPPKAREYAERLNLRGLEFRSWLSEGELRRLYRDIDVFAHARRDGETLGVAIVEAMLAQCAVITHVSAGYNEHHAFLREPFGRIAELDDVDGYHAAMAWYVDNRDRLGALGVAAREAVLPLFDPETITRKLLADMAETCDHLGRPRDAYDVL